MRVVCAISLGLKLFQCCAGVVFLVVPHDDLGYIGQSVNGTMSTGRIKR